MTTLDEAINEKFGRRNQKNGEYTAHWFLRDDIKLGDLKSFLHQKIVEAYETGLNENWGGDREIQLKDAREAGREKLKNKINSMKRVVNSAQSQLRQNIDIGYNAAIYDILALIDKK